MSEDGEGEHKAQRTSPYVAGYTGYIPGDKWRFGSHVRSNPNGGPLIIEETQPAVRVRLVRDEAPPPPPPRDPNRPRIIAGKLVGPDYVIGGKTGPGGRQRTSDYEVGPSPMAGYTGHIYGMEENGFGKPFPRAVEESKLAVMQKLNESVGGS